MNVGRKLRMACFCIHAFATASFAQSVVGCDTLIAHRGELHDAPEDSEVKVVNDPRLSDHALLRCRLTCAPRLPPPPRDTTEDDSRLRL